MSHLKEPLGLTLACSFLAMLGSVTAKRLPTTLKQVVQQQLLERESEIKDPLRDLYEIILPLSNCQIV